MFRWIDRYSSVVVRERLRLEEDIVSVLQVKRPVEMVWACF